MTKKIFCVIRAGLIVLIAGCALQPEKAEVAIPFDPAAKGAPSHRIDSPDFSARIYVYRAGMMANLGHNHIVVAREIAGELWVRSTPADSAFHLRLPVASFAVDPPELRAQAGADFASQPTE